MAFALLAPTAFGSSGVEEQRKYSFPPAAARNLLALEKGLGPFGFERHQTYVANDLYLDTPGRRMELEGYSLRIRRADKGPGKREYGLQLKSEADSPGVARMEVEWKELALEKAGGKPLLTLVDTIFERGYAEESERQAVSDWIAEKMGSAFAPFQEIRRRGMGGDRFYPRVMGRQDRVRFHVLVDRRTVRGDLAVLPTSERTKEDVPASFLADRARVWLMEASIDDAVFRSVSREATARHRISELEIENKYRPRETGTVLLNQLEKLLKKTYPINDGKASKYLQAVTSLEAAR